MKSGCFGEKMAAFFLMLLVAVPALIGPILFGCLHSFYVLAVLVPCFVGVALFFMKGRFATNWKVPPAMSMFVLVVLCLAVLHFTVAVPYLSSVYLLGLVGLLAAYLFWSTQCREWNDLRWLWGIVLVVLTALCWYGLWRYFLNDNEGLYYTQDRVVMYGQNPFYKGARVLGTYYSPNQFSDLIALGICLSAGLFFVKESGWVLKGVSAQYLLVAFPCLLLTGSRSGWVEILVGLSVLFALLLWKKSRILGLVLTVLFLCLLSGGVYLLWKYVPFVQERIATGSAGRLNIWPAVIEMIKERPWTGWGSGMFRFVHPVYKVLGNDKQVAFHSFNEYLQMAADNGLISLGLSMLAVGVWYVRWLLNYARAKVWRTAVVSAVVLAATSGALVHAVFDYNLTMYANSALLVLIMGSAAGVEFAGCNKALSKKANRARNGVGFLGAWSLLAVTLVLFMNQLYMFIGNRHLFVTKDYPAAVTYFDKAEKWYDGFFRVYHYRAVANLRMAKEQKRSNRSAFYQQALLDHTREYELNPHYTFGVYGLSSVFYKLGEREMSLAFIKEAISQDPKRILYWQVYFYQLNVSGDLAAIKESCRLALGAGVQNVHQLRGILNKYKITGVDLKVIEKEVRDNPQPIPRRIFMEDEMAMVPLYSWDYAEDGSVINWDHKLMKSD